MNALGKVSLYRFHIAITLFFVIVIALLTLYYRYPNEWRKWIKRERVSYSAATTLTTAVTQKPQADGAATSNADVPKEIPDVFAVRTWEPPPPPMPAAVEAPPEAPPLPFKFVGRIADPDKGIAFLITRRKEMMPVSVGDSIDGIYRVEKFENGQLYFLYQPLNIRQSLFVGSDS